ncbi:MAG: histidinol-phosphatase HisJ family protein [Candidatus Izemoplasma sp.]|nr:histidinol-phosphatase HisJ family protein [Candidatus Izemoplasma sp.]
MIHFTKDSHIHTHYSPDADQEATFSKYIKAAEKIGLSEITFTDHVDFDAKHPLFYDMIDYDNYINAFNQAKKEAKIRVRLGVEIGYQSHMAKTINAFIKTYPFEFVILSIHYVEQKDLYTQEYFESKTKQKAYQMYFDTVLDAINNIEQFDVIGHLDYITRYSPFGDYDYPIYKKQIDYILKALIERKKGIEINTSGLIKENRPYPKISVIKRFIELGGQTITLGSDSHQISELARGFDHINTLYNNEIKGMLFKNNSN